MKPPHFVVSFAAVAAVCLPLVPSPVRAAEIPAGVWVRDGYELSVAVEGIKIPRFLAVGPNNTLFVSVPKEGKIMACRDTDGDGKYETQTPFVTGKEPNTILQGMQWHDGWLWFAQLNAISRARDTNGNGKADEVVPVLGAEQLPTGARGGHMWRALLIHNGRIYTQVGDQTNVTDEPIEASERKKIWTFALDGSDKKLFATGLRNTEKLVVRPGTDEIWGVDHDIDLMAAKLEGDRKFGQPITDHNPPAELNHYVEGKFYGHPWILGKNQPNLALLTEPRLIEYASMTTIPEWLMAAHCSANSLTFYNGDKIPHANGDVFVAQRGGWNSTAKVGYCLSRILFENGHPYGEQKMVNFLKNGTEILGRPVDCTQATDGSLLFSDDFGHKVYRLKYVGK
ncbi:MAG: PQQ-dependent sugar dehydrogenase [Opitutaceae bacterium]|nr:PQQ-dependent sugar dehydrogenase [Opitutaceae bacterium]